MFADNVIALYKQLLSGFGDAVTRLFEGRQIGNDRYSLNITDMMRNGTWVEDKIITKVSDLNAKVRVEVLSRSINALWKTWCSNKMWVLFVTLDDPTQCETLDVGPTDFRYCADGRFYYTKNIDEEGIGGGGVNYPWGAESLKDDGNLLQDVTRASALS